jgi:hypothetical protein
VPTGRTQHGRLAANGLDRVVVEVVVGDEEEIGLDAG